MAYRFDPDHLHGISKELVGTPPSELFSVLATRLNEDYPGQIEMDCHWIVNNAGGAMGQIALLYASLSEYLLLFGTPIGTEGHSGRYRTDVYDFVIDGDMWCYYEGETERKEYGPGDAAFLGSRRVKGYRIPDHSWMLEYARGPIPLMVPFGLADSITSTLDLRTVGRTMWHYGRLCCRSLFNRDKSAARELKPARLPQK